MLFKLTALISLLVLSSCAPGLIYTDIVKPKCINMQSTLLGEREVKGGTTKLKVPAVRFDVSLEVNSRAIGDIAKLHGLSTIYYCDQRTLSILLGLYKKTEIIVYGK